MTIQEKYRRLRPMINNGDIILVRGYSLLAKAIQWGDSKDGENAYWNHALVVFKVGDRLLAIQSMAHGVEPDFLSTELMANEDFMILRPLFPQDLIDDCVNASFSKAESGIPYNVWMLPKVLFYRKSGWDIKRLGENPAKNICSVFAFWTYGQLLPLKCYSQYVIKQDFITPQDAIRFIDFKEITTISDPI